jgi:hypothetical protein
LDAGTLLLPENSEVLPAESVAVEVTTLCFEFVRMGTAKLPELLVFPAARNVRPSP